MSVRLKDQGKRRRTKAPVPASQSAEMRPPAVLRTDQIYHLCTLYPVTDVRKISCVLHMCCVESGLQQSRSA